MSLLWTLVALVVKKFNSLYIRSLEFEPSFAIRNDFAAK